MTADADDADARDGDDQLERAAEAVSDALSRCDVDWGVSDFDIARDYAYVAAPRADSGPIAIGFAATEIAGQHIAELSITAPRVIEPAPAGARIAFVVDASRSVGATGIAAQLSLIRGYLSHVPDASFEIIAYRRHAAPVFGALRGADALAELDAMIARPPARLAPGNGSHLDRGLAAAAAALARVPDGPRRIVAFTDDRLRRGFDVRAAARALRAAPGALVHVVDIGGLASDAKAFELDRDDDHRLAPLAADTGGILAHLGGGGDADAARAVALGLVRPVQIDYFEVDAVELFEGGADGVPDVLRAGDGLRALRVVDDELIRVTARGMLWNRPWKRTATVHAGRARWLPALVFGAEDWRDLDAATIAQIARVGSVVSPKTSLLARDLNARPVSFDDGAPGGVGYGTASCGCSLHNAVLRRPGGGGEPPALAPFVAGLLRERADACALIHGEPAPVQLTVETTGVEITDVRDVALASGAPADPGLAACVTEAAWDLALPAYVGDGDAIHRVVLD